MKNDSKPSSNGIINRLMEKIRQKITPELPFENYDDIATMHRLKDIDSHWALISDSLKIWRYFAKVNVIKSYEIEDIARFRPILLVHGYQSNHITWNWMVNKLWDDGFRIIFAMELDDYKKGIDHNVEQLVQVTDYILKVEPIYDRIDFIAHSMGGLVTKNYIKFYGGDKKSRIFLSLGAPLTGVFRIWSLLAKADDAVQASIDFRDQKKLKKINQTLTTDILYNLIQVHVIGSLRRYLGTDGLFKTKSVPDMINYYVPVSHFSLNKNDRVYYLIKQILTNKNWFYTIRLLFIQGIIVTEQAKGNVEEEVHEGLFDFIILKEDVTKGKKKEILEYYIKFEVKGKRSERYPRTKYLKVDPLEPYIPEEPLIIYSGFSPKEKKVELKLKIIVAPGETTTLFAQELELRKNREDNIEYLSLKSTNSAFYTINFQFAIYKFEIP